MDELEVRTRKIKIYHEKMEYKNFAYNEEMTYWKKVSLDRVLNGRKEKELADLAPLPQTPSPSLRVLLICKEKFEKTGNIDKIIFYLKSMYSTHNEEPRTFIDDIPTDKPSFEATTNVSKMMKILA